MMMDIADGGARHYVKMSSRICLEGQGPQWTGPARRSHSGNHEDLLMVAICMNAQEEDKEAAAPAAAGTGGGAARPARKLHGGNHEVCLMLSA